MPAPTWAMKEGHRILNLSITERKKQKLPTDDMGIAELLHVHPQSVYRWRNEVEEENKKPKHKRKSTPVENNEDADYQQVYDTLMELVVTHKSVLATKLWLDLKGYMVQKSEVNVKFDGSFFARADKQADRELSGQRDIQAGSRVEEVQEKSIVLRPDLCLPPGQGSGEDDTVRQLAAPAETDRPSTD